MPRVRTASSCRMLGKWYSTRTQASPSHAGGSIELLCNAPDMRLAWFVSWPGIKPTDIMKKMGEKWKTVAEEGKLKYTEMAAADKGRFADEKAVWDEAHPEPAPAPKVRVHAVLSLSRVQTRFRRLASEVAVAVAPERTHAHHCVVRSPE